MTMYLWDVYLTEQGHVKNFGKREVDKKFIKEHSWIPRIFYDRHGVAGWESAYTNPDYVVQFFCNDIDVDVIIRAAWGMWENARNPSKYGMEIEALRHYLKEMETNINAAYFLKRQALRRWDWLRDTENLEEDIVDWEQRVDDRIRRSKT
jgi:hypothetical protein